MIIKFTRDIHIINNLKINLLIEINILSSKDIIVNLSKAKIIFTKCDKVTILVQVTIRNNVQIRRIIRAKRR